ncbi:MAG: RNA polymerase sigma factor [Cyclobacteriaceae bacterium]
MSSKEFFNTFVRDQKAIITKICRSYSDSEEEFQDLFQEVALQLWRGYESFRSESKVSTWVYRVALNVCLTHFKKRKRKPPTSSIDNMLKEPVQEGIDPVHEQVALLYDAIKQLKEIERAIILLYLEDKQYNEIADILGMTRTNVGVRINRIKSQLKKYIDARVGHQGDMADSKAVNA